MKKGSLLILAVLIALALALPAAAAQPDLDRTGSIRLTMAYGGKPVAGGSMTLYRVGQVVRDGADLTFRPTGDFAAWSGELADVHSPELAKELARYAADQGLRGLRTPSATTERPCSGTWSRVSTC